MKKDNTLDIKACHSAWNKKIDQEVRKWGLEEEDQQDSNAKRNKTGSSAYLEDANNDANNERVKLEGETKQPAVASVDMVKKREGGLVVRDGVVTWGREGDYICQHCTKYLCVWEEKEEDIRIFDSSKHKHLPAEDCPPNNIRRKKVYRQMFLYINQGQPAQSAAHYFAH